MSYLLGLGDLLFQRNGLDSELRSLSGNTVNFKELFQLSLLFNNQLNLGLILIPELILYSLFSIQIYQYLFFQYRNSKNHMIIFVNYSISN